MASNWEESLVELVDLVSRIFEPEYDEDYFPKPSVVPRRRDKTYKLEQLDLFSQEYRTVMSEIKPSYIKVIRIDRVENKFLKRSFELKKIQNPELKVMKLFHLTSKKSADEICKHNFNWRMFGKRTKHNSFGCGVYFSDTAEYPIRFKQKLRGERVIFLSDVLVGRICKGNKTMRIPPEGINSSVKSLRNFREVVKYHDNEFYPTYKVTIGFKKDYEMRRPFTFDPSKAELQSFTGEHESEEDDKYSSASEDDDDSSEMEDVEYYSGTYSNSEVVPVSNSSFSGNFGRHNDSHDQDIADSSSSIGIALGATAAIVGTGLLALFLSDRNRNRND